MALEVEELRERIKSAESLYSIVETMRTLAAVNIRRANQAASAAREYLRSVHIALYVALQGYRGPAAARSSGHSPGRSSSAGTTRSFAGTSRPSAAGTARSSPVGSARSSVDAAARSSAGLTEPSSGDGPERPTTTRRSGTSRRPVARSPGARLRGAGSSRARRPAEAIPPILLVLSSNQGLCGTFNDRVTNRALTLGNEISKSLGIDRSELVYVCVGYRGADRLETAGVHVASVFDAPASVEAVGPLVRAIYATVADLLEPGRRLLGIYNQTTSGSTFVESEVQLFPLDLSRWRTLPEGEAPFATIPLVAGGSVEAVLPDLVRELLYIDLYRILVESFAAENAARMISMQGATENIEELLAELNAAYRAARQDAITNELMDILGGIFAMDGQS